jgi:hypothetical protein
LAKEPNTWKIVDDQPGFRPDGVQLAVGTKFSSNGKEAQLYDRVFEFARKDRVVYVRCAHEKRDFLAS